MARSANRVPCLIFVGVAALLLALHGQRMVLTNDEGIVLESAQRMASGGRIYVDFFGYMSPGSYWMQALVFRLLGVALWTGRLIVILDFALQCALVYWLAARFSASSAPWRVATAVTLTFAGFQVADPAFLTSAHRWDSATSALVGLCTAVSAFRDGRRWKWAFSGGALAAAAWCTPSMLIVAIVVIVWLAISRDRRNCLIPVLGGAAIIGLAGIAALVSTGSLRAFFAQMAWLRQNYAGVNVLQYGSIIGGYRSLFEGAHGMLETTIRLILIGCVALPAILPPLAILLGVLAVWRRKMDAQRDVLVLLLMATVGLTVTAFPRADVMHLAFIAALPYVLVGCALANLLPGRAASWLSIVSILLATVFASNYLRGWQQSSPVASPAGTLQVARDQAPDVRRLMQQVHPGDSLFVYPYMPVQYFLTQARNPTRFPYLQPGMMTREQAAEALAQLQIRPPEWLLYMQLSREELLRVFPNGAGRDWRFPELESWMQENYRPVESPPIRLGGYALWRRVPPAVAAAHR
jgi:4-amino-4-deoxy-L-arabinose transferase-like glycosyltransferase